MADENIETQLGEAELGELLQHLQSEETASLEGTLDSVESLQLWISDHPGLRQMVVVEKIGQIGPAILQFLRGLLGFDSSAGSDSDKPNEPLDEQS